MENILDSLYWRYAVKAFNPERIVSEEKIGKLASAFNLTATSYGLQPIRLLVVHNRDLQEDLVPGAYGQRQVVDASHLLVLCIEKSIDRDYIEAYFERVQEIRGTAEEILKPFRSGLLDTFSKMTADEIRAWAINQAYLAMGNLLTVCAVERIDSCPMEGFVPAVYEELLALDKKSLEPVLLLPVGYRSETDMFSGFEKVRRSETDSVFYHK